MIVLFQLIVHDRTILALNHEDGLLDLNALDFIRKDRKRVEAKLLQVTEALWMNNSRITIGGKLKSLSFNEEGFFEFRKQHKTPDRRLGRGHKQAMVATRVQTDDRRGGEASKAVGFQPLATESRVHVTADFWFELNHGCSCV